jgi:hypothetical protein
VLAPALLGLAASGCAASSNDADPSVHAFSDTLSGPLLAERAWLSDPTLTAIRFSENMLHLRSTPTQTAFVRARFLPGKSESPAAESSESLRWRARVVLTGTFFIVLDAEFAGAPFRVQVTPYGAHVTASGPDRIAQGYEVHLPPRWSVRGGEWRLDRSRSACELWAMEHRLWRGDVAGPLSALAFGEAYVDALHGGELWLSNVRWNRSRQGRSPSGT